MNKLNHTVLAGRTKRPRLLMVICIAVLALLVYGRVQAAEGDEKPRKRPNHIFDVTYLYAYSGDSEQHGVATRFINNFPINKDYAVMNIFSFDFLATGLPPGITNLYGFSEFLRIKLWRFEILGGFSNRSDKPFKRIDDIGITAGAAYTIPLAPRHSLAVGVVYSSLLVRNIGFHIPLPMVYYTYRDRKLFAMVGVQSRIRWNPLAWFGLLFYYRPILNISCGIQFRPVRFIMLTTKYTIKQQWYNLENRSSDTEKLFQSYQEVGEQFQMYFSRYASLNVFAGFRFREAWYYADKEIALYDSSYRSIMWLADSFVLRVGVRVML